MAAALRLEAILIQAPLSFKVAGGRPLICREKSRQAAQNIWTALLFSSTAATVQAGRCTEWKMSV